MGALYRDRVWQNKGLKGGRLLVMLALADHADANGECYPGMPLLMEKTRLTDRQLRRVLNSLDADGLISIEERAIGRGKRPHYKLFPGEKADIISEIKADILSDQEEKSGHFVQEKRTFLTEKADISGANYSHVRREPTTEPKAEPEGESAPARKVVHFKSPHFDPRRFVNGHIAPGTGTTAVEVYYERFDIRQDAARLSAILEDDLVRGCPDLDKLRQVIIAYSQHQNYRPGNVALILDWYRDGIPKKDKPPGGTNGYHQNGTAGSVDREMLLTRAKLARASIKTAELTGMPIDPRDLKAIEAAKGLA